MKNKLEITLEHYDRKCADGCCDLFGTIVRVNGVEMPFHDEDTGTILEQVLEHLGYDVKVEVIYDN